MSNRITVNMLEGMIRAINKAAGTPEAAYSKQADGSYKPNANNYHLSGAYGGYALEQMSSRKGCSGISSVFNCGHVPKRDLYNRMRAFLSGLEVSK